jgi:hypothetical protein
VVFAYTYDISLKGDALLDSVIAIVVPSIVMMGMVMSKEEIIPPGMKD